MSGENTDSLECGFVKPRCCKAGVTNETARSSWFGHRALEFIQATPWPLLLQRAVRKVEAGFSWRLNPIREPPASQ